MTQLTLAQDANSPATTNSEDTGSLEKLLARIGLEATQNLLNPSQDANPPDVAVRTAKHVIFLLDGMHYAIPLANVLEILRLPRVTALPDVPEWLRGVTNLRGEVVSVVDLRVLLGLTRGDDSVSPRLVVVRSLSEEITTGWVVDRVVGIRGLVPEEIKPCATPAAGRITSFLQGLVNQDGRLVAVLDVDRILTSPELRQFDVEA